MSATRVVHIRSGEPYDVYIGRRVPGLAGSIWSNPFRIGPGGTRDECVDQYARWVVQQRGLMARLGDLRGKTLACWCAPARCHGHVLAALADALPEP